MRVFKDGVSRKVNSHVNNKSPVGVQVTKCTVAMEIRKSASIN